MGFADAINPDGTMDDQLRARGWTFHEGGAHAPAGVVDPKFNPDGPLGVHPGDASIRRGRMTLQVEVDEDGQPHHGNGATARLTARTGEGATGMSDEKPHREVKIQTGKSQAEDGPRPPTREDYERQGDIGPGVEWVVSLEPSSVLGEPPPYGGPYYRPPKVWVARRYRDGVHEDRLMAGERGVIEDVLGRQFGFTRHDEDGREVWR